MTDYSKLTDTEINERLAIEVMGWHVEGNIWFDADGGAHGYVHSDWNPSEDLNQMHAVEDRLIELGLQDDYIDWLTDDWLADNSTTYTNGWSFAIAHATAHQKAIAALMAWEGK